jgi:Carboxypeptidase regulatory-like domain
MNTKFHHGGNEMSLTNVNRTLVTGIATGALLFVAQSVLAADGGNVQRVVSDASGKPIAGAFVKLKNDQKRLTFMVISREQGRFEAKDLPPGRYRVQGVAGDNQSEWFSNVTVAPGGEDAKVGLLLTGKRGPSRRHGRNGYRKSRSTRRPRMKPACRKGPGGNSSPSGALHATTCSAWWSRDPIPITGITPSAACARA